jgi:hypothetical protein
VFFRDDKIDTPYIYFIVCLGVRYFEVISFSVTLGLILDEAQTGSTQYGVAEHPTANSLI